MKSEVQANLLKKSGNELYLKSKKFTEALIKYNEALCYAETDELKSLLCGNRSAIYFEVKRYKLCFFNIQAAKKYGYPQDKLGKLLAREQKCKELLRAGKDVKDDDKKVADFFKLSYKSHPKIPFIIDGIELKTSENFGNYLITNRDLKTGDIIAAEPFLTRIGSLFHEFRYEKCAYCLRHNFYNLMPCEGCCDNMYCSQSCRVEHYLLCGVCFPPPVSAKFSWFEVTQRILMPALGEFESMEEFVKLFKNPKKLTIFDVDDLSRKNIFKIFSSMVAAENRKSDIVNSNLCRAYPSNLCEMNGFEEMFIQVNTIYSTNMMIFEQWTDDDDNEEESDVRTTGGSVGLFGSLFNHSCNQNIHRVTLDNKFVFYACRPIKAGEQLFVNYGAIYEKESLKVRRDFLKSYDFVCKCDACKKDFPLLQNLPKSDKIDEVPQLDTSTIDTLTDTFSKCCNFINKFQNEHPCLELTFVINLNHAIMNRMAKVRL